MLEQKTPTDPSHTFANCTTDVSLHRTGAAYSSAMGARILVVDDEEAIGRVMRRVLFGYEVTAVTSGRDALERVQRGEPFDAVICDVNMPEMDGIEFAARLALIAPELANNILFVTGDQDAARKLSGRHVLTIPFETHALRSRLEELVRPMVRPGQRAAVDAAADGPSVVSVSKRPTVRPPRGAGENEG